MNIAQPSLEQMQVHSREAANLLKQMSNPHRLMILCTLSAAGELTVGQLNERISLSQSALSQHLASLRRADLVATRKEAQTVSYRVKGEKAIQVIGVLQSIYCGDLR